MAKRGNAESTAKTPRRQVARKETSPGGASVPASRSLSAATIREVAQEDVRPTDRLAKPSSFLDIRVVYCGDNLEQLAKLPD